MQNIRAFERRVCAQNHLILFIILLKNQSRILSDSKQLKHTHHCFHWKIYFTDSKIHLSLSINAFYYNDRRCSEVALTSI